MADDDQKGAAPSIPITLRSGGQSVQAKSLIKMPTEGEKNLYSSQQVRTCGGCKYMQRDEKTQQKIRQSDIGRKLAHEYKWKPEHMPGKLKDMGICAQKQDVLVGAVSRACEWYKAK